MKLENLIIIFIALALPIILILSLFVELSVDTVANKIKYKTYLDKAAHETIVAYELNTTSDKYKSPDITEDNRMRDIDASMNMFSQNMASFFGQSSASKSAIMTYVPCLLFTLYDGYYVYVPSPVDGISSSDYSTFIHRLKPCAYYVKIYECNDGTLALINYTIDNYIRITTIKEDQYIESKGYLVPDGTNDGNQYEPNITDIFNEIADKCADLTPISTSNSPYPWEESTFNEEKFKVMQDSITQGLEQGMTLYRRYTGMSNFTMPELTTTDWEMILHNTCFAAFMQGLPVGLSTYNTYTIAISTGNNDAVVDTDIYFSDGTYYHRIGCEKLTDFSQGFSLQNMSEEQRNLKPCYYCVIHTTESSFQSLDGKSNAEERKKAYHKAMSEARNSLPKG